MDNANNQESRRIVVVGAGHGGGFVVGFLRQYGFTGKLTLIGDEPVAPYHRPPLSKAWLKGEAKLAELALKPGSFYEDQRVDLRLGCRVEAIDRSAREVVLTTGERVPYDDLILATGAGARTLALPGARHGNVLTLRTLADAERLRTCIGPGRRLAIIGGGYVGLECAATARALGGEATVIERAQRPLERVASVVISDFLRAYHERRGVSFALDATVEAIEGDEAAEAVRLADGRRFPCDAVLVGIGATPATGPAEAAGIACDDGIGVDPDCRTSDPCIFAIGDVARRPHALYDRALRLESVPSCMEQAKRVAAVLTGRAPAPPEVPWFWSDQYDLKLQIAGLPFGASETVVRGKPENGQFGVFHLAEGRVVTVEAVNAPPEFFAGKKLIASGKRVSAVQLADTGASLSEIAA